MKGLRTNCWTSESKIVDDLSYEIRYTDHGKIFQLVGCPTGYESFYIDDGAVKRMSEHGWQACVGTDRRWDELVIPAEEMKKAFSEIRELK